MSLIQVCSTSRNEANVNQQQQGFRFSNYFNGVLEVPPYSEVALHSGNFKINTGQEAINFVSVGGNLGSQQPVVRLNMIDNEDDYGNSVDYERSTNSVMNPFLYQVPRKSYNSTKDFWDDMKITLNLDPRPQFVYNENLNGDFVSGLQITTSIINETITPSLKWTCNVPIQTPVDINPITFKTMKNKAGTDLITLTGGKIKQVASVVSGKQISHNVFYTQSTGIHNGNGYFKNNYFFTEQVNFGDLPLPVQNRQILFGVKRWGEIDTSSNKSSTTSWIKMREASTEANLTAIRDYVGEESENINIAYLTCPLLFEASGYNLSAECIGEYVLHTTCKVETLINPETNKVEISSFNKNYKSMVCNILKYEVGGSQTGLQNGRYVMIATGDPQISSTLNVPYSLELNPESGLPSWDKGGTIMYMIRNGETGADFSSLDNRIIINGNKVSFMVNGVMVNVRSEVAEDDDTILEEFISDGVFPLQAFGTTAKNNAGLLNARLIPTLESQSEVKYLGDRQTDFQRYVASKQIIPASIYNNFLDRSPCMFYEGEDQYPLPFNPTPNIPSYPVASGGTDVYEMTPHLYLGETQVGNVIELQETDQSQKVYQPNISLTLASPESITLNATDNSYIVSEETYDTTTGTNPLLIGLYVRLKNLTNKSTFGSINTPDADKLIGVINRYDHTNDAEGLASFPTYTFNEYEKLYISLNNPKPIYITQLDFEIVDKFSNPVQEIRETTLVLHMRPAQYKDLYSYKREELR
jgi:hypothetical protein